MFVLDSFSLTFFSRHDDNQNVCGYDYKIYTLFLMISIPRNEFFLSFFLLKKMNKYQITVLRSKFSWTAKIDFALPMSQMAVTIFFKKMCKVITALKGNRTVSDVNGKEWQYLNFLSSFFFLSLLRYKDVLKVYQHDPLPKISILKLGHWNIDFAPGRLLFCTSSSI